MKLKTIKEVDKFLEIVDSCRGEIIITSQYGDRYNLKSSPINYMHPRTFNLISSMLQEIETKFCNQNYYSINEVLESVRNIGLFTRARFAQYGTKPESELTNEDSYKIVARVRKERKKFWEQYFPLSLEQQR